MSKTIDISDRIRELSEILMPGPNHVTTDVLHLLPLIVWSMGAMQMLSTFPQRWLAEFSKVVAPVSPQDDGPVTALVFRQKLIGYYQKKPPHAELLARTKNFIRERLTLDGPTNVEIMVSALMLVLELPADESETNTDLNTNTVGGFVEWK